MRVGQKDVIGLLWIDESRASIGTLRDNAEYSFPWAYRLHEADEFARAIKKARQVSYGRWVFFRFNAGLPHPRLGIVIGKRWVKRAVDRNRLKRWAREQFRLSVPELAAYDYIVRLRSRQRISPRELPVLRAELCHLFAMLPQRNKEPCPTH